MGKTCAKKDKVSSKIKAFNTHFVFFFNFQNTNTNYFKY